MGREGKIRNQENRIAFGVQCWKSISVKIFIVLNKMKLEWKQFGMVRLVISGMWGIKEKRNQSDSCVFYAVARNGGHA